MAALRDPDLDNYYQTGSTAPVVRTATVISSEVSVTVLPSASRTHLAKMSHQWGWEELRDYVVSQIERYHGPFPRNFEREAAIFRSFVSRWGKQAGPIAEVAFGDTYRGMWRGAPIRVIRFCKASDDYFARLIADTL